MCRVLYIDDTAEQRHLYTSLLQLSSVDVVALDGREGDEIDWRGFDLVLVDVMMPGRPGDELVRRQVARHRNYTLPTIVLFSVLPLVDLHDMVIKLKRDTGLVAIYSLSKIAAFTDTLRALKVLIEHVDAAVGRP